MFHQSFQNGGRTVLKVGSGFEMEWMKFLGLKRKRRMDEPM